MDNSSLSAQAETQEIGVVITWLGNVSHVNSLLLRHEAQEGEDNQTGKHRGAGVDAADDERVLVDVVVVFVVRSESNNSSESKSVGEENL